MAKLPSPNDIGRPTPRFGGSVPKIQVRDEGEQAMTRVGQSVAGFGEAMLKVKIKDDKFRVEEATTRLQQKRLELYKGENGFVNTRSGDVVEDKDFHTNRMAEFDSSAKEIANSLGNDDQRMMFNSRAGVNRNGHESDLLNHMTSERNTFYEQAYKGGIASDVDIAASEYDNPDKVQAAIERTKHLTEAETERLGITGEAKKTMLKENQSNIHESVIRQAIDDGNHFYAKEWYGKNEKNIQGDRQDDIKKLLRSSGIRAESQAAMDSYDDLSEADALKKARKDFKNDPEIRDATVQRIKARSGEEAQQLDANQKAAGEQAWSIYGTSKDIDDVPVSVLESMDGKERVALEGVAAKLAAGAKVDTDWAAYYGLKEMVSNDPAQFKTLNLMGYANHLGDTEMKELIKLQTDDKGIKLARNKSQVMKQGADNIGINKKQIKQGFGDDIEKYYQRIDEELRAFQEQTGKEPTTDDISKIVDDLSIKIMKDPTAWFFTGERAAYSAEIDGVPAEMVDNLARALTGKIDVDGKPVVISDENILKLYNYTMTNR